LTNSSTETRAKIAPTEEFDLGARLRALRAEKGLSQRELARRAGVTHATLSLLERNLASPSVSSLKKVVQELGMSLSEFFSTGSRSRKSVFHRQEDFFTLLDGPITMQQIGKDLQDSLLQFIVMRFEPNSDTGEQKYTHEGEEGGLIIQGQLELTVGEKTQLLEAGDAFHFDSSTPHRYRNIGKETCIVFTAGTPPSF